MCGMSDSDNQYVSEWCVRVYGDDMLNTSVYDESVCERREHDRMCDDCFTIVCWVHDCLLSV